MKGVGGEFQHFHWCDIGYTVASRAAIAAVAGIVPIDTSMYIHEPMDFRRFGYEAGPPVLGFGFVTPQPTPRVEPKLPPLTLAQHQRFLDDQTDLAGRTRIELDEQEDLLRVRCLKWLASELQVPVAYWHHEGDHGLIGEYAWGFGHSEMMFYNDAERASPGPLSDRPASALTACFRHLGVQLANVTEAAWMHSPLTFRLVEERPFFV